MLNFHMMPTSQSLQNMMSTNTYDDYKYVYDENYDYYSQELNDYYGQQNIIAPAPTPILPPFIPPSPTPLPPMPPPGNYIFVC